MSLESMKLRLNYRGGASQQARFQKDKLKSLKKALLYSYQAATMVLERDGQPLEFRCLINDDKVSGDYDNRVLSIPFEDICLNLPMDGKTESSFYPINLQCGQVFLWKQTNTHWLVYLRHLQEDAYFRAQIRRCDQQVQVGDKMYWTYIRGPVETSLNFAQKAGIHFNDLNYSLLMFITKDDNTLRHLHRFSKIKICQQGTSIIKTWQVVAVDPYFGDNVIQVMLDEYFENQVEEMRQQEIANTPKPQPVPTPQAYITGPTQVYSYDNVTYEIVNRSGGSWYWVEKGHQELLCSDREKINLEINQGKRGKFKIVYKVNGEQIQLEVTRKAF